MKTDKGILEGAEKPRFRLGRPIRSEMYKDTIFRGITPLNNVAEYVLSLNFPYWETQDAKYYKLYDNIFIYCK